MTHTDARRFTQIICAVVLLFALSQGAQWAYLTHYTDQKTRVVCPMLSTLTGEPGARPTSKYGQTLRDRATIAEKQLGCSDV